MVCCCPARLRPHGSNKTNPGEGDHVGGDETQALRRRGERQCVAGRGRGGVRVRVDELRGGEKVKWD